MRILLRMGIALAFVLVVFGASLSALAVLGALALLDRVEQRS